MPSLRQLQAFTAVMETRSISRAADRMLLSQPAVSKLIRALEDESQLRLFTRHKKRLAPTAEAHFYLAEAANLLDNLLRLERLALDLKSMVLTNLTIACFPALGVSLMPRIINGFQQRHEGSSNTLLIHDSPKVVQLAIAQQFDLGLSMMPAIHNDVYSVPCLHMECMVVMPPSHRLAGRDVVDVHDLDSEQFVSHGYDDRSVFMFDDYFAKAGVSRKITGRVAYTTAICEFVREGAGVAVVDPITARHPVASGLASARLTPPLVLEAHLLIPKRRPVSSAGERFHSYLQEYLDAGIPGTRPLPCNFGR